MKQFFNTLAVGLTLGVAASTAQATLIDRGNGMIYDEDLNITWLADANLFKTQYDADNSILNRLIGQTLVDSYYGSRTAVAGDFNTDTGAMSWWGAQAWVADLNFGGYDDWRLPTTLQPDSTCSGQSAGFSYGFNCTGSELGHLFYSELGGNAGTSISSAHNANYNLFANIQADKYWSETESAIFTNRTWEFDTISGYQNAVVKNYQFYGWAVRSGDISASVLTDVAAVPEPAMLWLFGAGMVGLLGFRRRNPNQKKFLQLLTAGLALNLAVTTAYAGPISNVNGPVLLPGQTISIPGGSLIIVGDFGSHNDIIWAVSDTQGSGAGQPEAGTDVGVENQGTAASIAASLLLLDSLNNASNQGNSNNNAPLFADTPQATSTAVPEPGVLGLFALGLAGLMGVKRHRAS